jgi:hypothetical protein
VYIVRTAARSKNKNVKTKITRRRVGAHEKDRQVAGLCN